MNTYKVDIDALGDNTSHIQIINKIPFHSTVLDVGCACGDLGKYLNQNKTCVMYGLEYNKESIAIAEKTRAYDEIEELDLNYFSELPSRFAQEYDIIVFGDILEHLYSPEETIRKFLPYLKQNGRIIISLPNVSHGSIIRQLLNNNFHYMDYGVLDRTHIRFFTHTSIASMISTLGLEIVTSNKIIYGLNGLHQKKYFEHDSEYLLKALSENKHFYVFQYVFDVVKSTVKYNKLLKLNIDTLNSFTIKENELISSVKPGGDTPLKNLNTPCQENHHNVSLLKMKLKKHTPPHIWSAMKKVYGMRKYYSKVKNSFKSYTTYKNYINHILSNGEKVGRSGDFVDISAQQYTPAPNCPKAIAFYLPQFYPFEENNRWWGKGFTEWTNVTRAVPQFPGHYQPQLPIDMGFYDLRVPEIMARQIELAKLYGIYGFCFHYYWFSGKRLMEKPLFNFLNKKEYDINFCLCWANEPWSRRWDGSENELLLGQNLRPEDDYKFIDDIAMFLTDDRYIAINGKSVIIIYRPHLWEKDRVVELATHFREQAKKYNKELYLVFALSHEFDGIPTEWGFDAAVEFPPHLCFTINPVRNPGIINPQFNGVIYDMAELLLHQKSKQPKNHTVFPTVFPGWDNTPRKGANACIFHNSTPQIYEDWLRIAVDYSFQNNPPSERFVFINAWNEWGEGAHLEPDRKYGYAFLQSTGKILSQFNKS